MTRNREKPRKMSYILEPMWEIMRTRLNETLPEAAVKEWIDHFDLISLQKKKAVFLYVGNGNLDSFQELYYDQFADCVFEVLGYEVGIDFKQKKTRVQKKHVVTRKISLVLLSVFLIALACFVVLIGSSYIKNLNFKETFYQVGSGKINENLRIIEIADLHNTTFGSGNQELLRRIGLLSPDLIVMAGDCIDQNDASDDVMLSLCRQLVEIAPVYYIYGNNEVSKQYHSDMSLDSIDRLLGVSGGERDSSKFHQMKDGLRDRLESMGVTVLLNESATIELGGNVIDIYGTLTSNPSAFWPYAEASFGDFLNTDADHFKLMVTHEPYIYENLAEEYWGDLILCGHTHGGIMQLPYLGGLYERQDGWFPERRGAYILGQYEVSGTPLIVSSGLTNRGFDGILRLNNQPELVIVDVNRY